MELLKWCPVYQGCHSHLGGGVCVHNSSLHSFFARSLEVARCSKLLSGYNVYLSPSIKPPPKEMADIVKCSGGEVLTTLPHPVGVGVLVVASQDDLSMLSGAVEAGVPLYSTELILGGVLRQELDLESYPDI